MGKKNAAKESGEKMNGREMSDNVALDPNHQSAVVHFLDSTKKTFSIPKIAEGNELFGMVIAYLGINEKEYFALSFTDNDGNRHWIYDDKRITKQLKGHPWQFNFGVKFYPPDPETLSDDLTRHYICLQVRRDISTGGLPATLPTYALLGSYVAQSVLGDCVPSIQYVDFLRECHMAPIPSDTLYERVEELHKQHRGLTKSDADSHYLDIAKKLSMYGVHLFPAKDGKGTLVQIVVSAQGVSIYRDQIRVHRFLWQNIVKIAYRRNVFIIKVKPGELEKNDTAVLLKLSHYEVAKSVWKCVVEHHTFFRLIQPDEKPPEGLFRWGSSKFRYQGRTQFQSKMAAQLFTNQNPVQRSQSLRLAPDGDTGDKYIAKNQTLPLNFAENESRKKINETFGVTFTPPKMQDMSKNIDEEKDEVGKTKALYSGGSSGKMHDESCMIVTGSSLDREDASLHSSNFHFSSQKVPAVLPTHQSDRIIESTYQNSSFPTKTDIICSGPNIMDLRKERDMNFLPATSGTVVYHPGHYEHEAVKHRTGPLREPPYEFGDDFVLLHRPISTGVSGKIYHVDGSESEILIKENEIETRPVRYFSDVYHSGMNKYTGGNRNIKLFKREKFEGAEDTLDKGDIDKTKYPKNISCRDNVLRIEPTLDVQPQPLKAYCTIYHDNRKEESSSISAESENENACNKERLKLRKKADLESSKEKMEAIDSSNSANPNQETASIEKEKLVYMDPNSNNFTEKSHEMVNFLKSPMNDLMVGSSANRYFLTEKDEELPISPIIGHVHHSGVSHKKGKKRHHVGSDLYKKSPVSDSSTDDEVNSRMKFVASIRLSEMQRQNEKEAVKRSSKLMPSKDFAAKKVIGVQHTPYQKEISEKKTDGKNEGNTNLHELSSSAKVRKMSSEMENNMKNRLNELENSEIEDGNLTAANLVPKMEMNFKPLISVLDNVKQVERFPIFHVFKRKRHNGQTEYTSKKYVDPNSYKLSPLPYHGALNNTLRAQELNFSPVQNHSSIYHNGYSYSGPNIKKSMGRRTDDTIKRKRAFKRGVHNGDVEIIEKPFVKPETYQLKTDPYVGPLASLIYHKDVSSFPLLQYSTAYYYERGLASHTGSESDLSTTSSNSTTQHEASTAMQTFFSRKSQNLESVGLKKPPNSVFSILKELPKKEKGLIEVKVDDKLEKAKRIIKIPPEIPPKPSSNNFFTTFTMNSSGDASNLSLSGSEYESGDQTSQVNAKIFMKNGHSSKNEVVESDKMRNVYSLEEKKKKFDENSFEHKISTDLNRSDLKDGGNDVTHISEKEARIDKPTESSGILSALSAVRGYEMSTSNELPYEPLRSRISMKIDPVSAKVDVDDSQESAFHRDGVESDATELKKNTSSLETEQAKSLKLKGINPRGPPSDGRVNFDSVTEDKIYRKDLSQADVHDDVNAICIKSGDQKKDEKNKKIAVLRMRDEKLIDNHEITLANKVKDDKGKSRKGFLSFLRERKTKSKSNKKNASEKNDKKQQQEVVDVIESTASALHYTDVKDDSKFSVHYPQSTTTPNKYIPVYDFSFVPTFANDESLCYVSNDNKKSCIDAEIDLEQNVNSRKDLIGKITQVSPVNKLKEGPSLLVYSETLSTCKDSLDPFSAKSLSDASADPYHFTEIPPDNQSTSVDQKSHTVVGQIKRQFAQVVSKTSSTSKKNKSKKDRLKSEALDSSECSSPLETEPVEQHDGLTFTEPSENVVDVHLEKLSYEEATLDEGNGHGKVTDETNKDGSASFTYVNQSGSPSHETVHSLSKTTESPESRINDVLDHQGNIVKRTIKTEQVKHTIQKETYQTNVKLHQNGNSGFHVVETSEETITPIRGKIVSSTEVPILETRTHTLAYESAKDSAKTNDGEYSDIPGELISCRTITQGNRTIETITYKTEKNGMIETHVEHRVTIQSGGSIDHDAELSQAILEATNMNPDMTVEKIEVKQESQC